MTGPRSPNVWEVRRRAREGLWEAPLCREGAPLSREALQGGVRRLVILMVVLQNAFRL